DGSPDVPGGVLLDLLCTVPGIGKITALTWVYTVCDPLRFPTSKAVAAFCGCDPTLKISAGKVTAHVRRGGNKDLHIALVQAAMGLVGRASEPIGRWGARLAAKPGRGQWRKAVGAVARRLAVGLYHVHLKIEPFSYLKYNLDLRLEVPDVPIEACGFTRRCAENLRRHGIEDAPTLLARYSTDLAKVKGIGSKTYQGRSGHGWRHCGHRRTPGGIFLRGTVMGRSRKQMENGYRYMYAVDTGYGVMRLSAWGDHEFLRIGDDIDVSVEIRAFTTGKGRPMYQLSLPTNSLNEGEESF